MTYQDFSRRHQTLCGFLACVAGDKSYPIPRNADLLRSLSSLCKYRQTDDHRCAIAQPKTQKILHLFRQSIIYKLNCKNFQLTHLILCKHIINTNSDKTLYVVYHFAADQTDNRFPNSLYDNYHN